MAAVARHLGGIIGGWTRAWRGWRDNPLPRYWAEAEERRLSAKAWWARSPGLMLWGALLSLGATAVLVYYSVRVIGLAASVSSRAYIQTLFISGTALLLIGVLLFALVWLLARFFTVAQLALGFLETEQRQRTRQTLDDMLVVTQLSEQETLVGLGVHALRLILPPLALLSASAVLRAAVNLYAGGSRWYVSASQSGDSSPAAVAGVLLVLVPVAALVSGCLATLALTYMLVSLSLAQRSGLAPSIGAAAQVVMQLLLLAGAGYVLYTALDFDVGELGAGFPSGLAAVLLLLIGFLLYLARRASWIRLALAYAFPLVLVAVALVLYADLTLEGIETAYYASALSNVLWVVQSLAVASLVHLSVVGEGASGSPTAWWLHCLFLALQVGLVVMCAEFARDAIRRRKWGGEKA